MHRTIIAISAALAFSAAPALAAGEKPARESAKPAPASTAAAQDAKGFIEKAAMTDLAERQMAQLALTKASSADVKQYAQKMMEDHTRTTQELTPIAQQKDVQPPRQLDSKHQAMLDRLEKLSGPEFDREYMEIQAQAHQQAVELFQRAAQQAGDKEIQAFAKKTTPALQQHLTEARQVVASLPGGTAAGAGKTQ